MIEYTVEMTIKLDGDADGTSAGSIKGMLDRIVRAEGRKEGSGYEGLAVVRGTQGIEVIRTTPEKTTDPFVYKNARLTNVNYGEHMVVSVSDHWWSLVGLRDGESYDAELHASIQKVLDSLVCREDWTLINKGSGGDPGTWEGKVDL